MPSMIQLFSPQGWNDYELIDCGGNEKLERFGKYILIRPEPQAVWNKGLNEEEWTKLHHIRFKGRNSNSGDWIKKRGDIPDRWNIKYDHGGLTLNFRLTLTSFKHLGIFPEQSFNWDTIFKFFSTFHTKTTLVNFENGNSDLIPKFLNLFAYTGGASLAAKTVGADVTHVDSIKQVLHWASDNQTLNGLKDIRWVLEDALKFVKREVKREKLYQGIILDPPAYGNGPNGEKWKLEDQIQELISEVVQLLDPKKHLLILNTYSLGFSPLIIHNLLKSSYKDSGKIEIGELYLNSTTNFELPLGIVGRIVKS